MVNSNVLRGLVFAAALAVSPGAYAQQSGGIRGMVYDADFEAPLGAARVEIAETGATAETAEEGNYVFGDVAPGTYTLIFSKEGFNRRVQSDVAVSPGRMTEVDAWLTGEFVEMEEFIVQDVNLDAGSEAALLELRVNSPSLLDSIGSDLMGRAGAGDAAGALRLVAGASVRDGKFAVIRGLPDRYVNSQMNGVRLPSADADTRAVELDQFPSEVIESIQVSKTFTPDQQGDASGGAVNVVLKGIPDETVFRMGLGTEVNARVGFRDDFLSYNGGGLGFLGKDGSHGIPADGQFGGAVGVSEERSPAEYDFDMTAGSSYTFGNGVKVGGFASVFYERDASFYEGGIDDKYWVERPGGPMTPQYVQGTPRQGEFKTQLFDVTQGSESVRWGGLGAAGIETEHHSLSVQNLWSRMAEDTATLAEDTRGKQFYFPGHDPHDSSTPGHDDGFAAPYLRNETLQYTERTTHTLQLKGTHEAPLSDFGFEDTLMFQPPELDWTVAFSSAERYEPDKRQFGGFWTPERTIAVGGNEFTTPATHWPFKPAENFTLGNVQRTWEDIMEDSDQFQVNVTFPFEQWSGDEGYFKLGVFNDEVNRQYDQDTFSNFNNNGVKYEADWEDSFSGAFPDLPSAGAITAGPPFVDVDYEGEQSIVAGYGMVDAPLSSSLSIIGGARYESTGIGIVNHPEKDVTWIPPGSSGAVALNPGDADVTFGQDDILPSLGLVYTPAERVTLRGSFGKTVARQTFKELSPIQQQEFLGGDVFIGNPFLRMSELSNYDLRLDYTPYEGGLASISYFYKDIEDPIEFVQRFAGFTYTTPVNYPKGKISGFELEVRQSLERFWDEFEGLSAGSNVTLINSEVTLPPDEAAGFGLPNIKAPMSSRDMTNAPEYLYNLFLTYDFEHIGWSGAELGLFYTVQGDTLVAGAGQSGGNFVPSVYETEYGTLNLSLTQRFGDNWSVKLQAKNLLDPAIETVYRSEYIDDDVTKSSYRNGMEFSISVSATF